MLVVSQNPWVQCGFSRVKWDWFRRYIYSLEYTSVPNGRHKLFCDIANARGSDNRDSTTLLQLLESRRGLGVSDPRDMLFGHIGISSDIVKQQKYQQKDLVNDNGENNDSKLITSSAKLEVLSIDYNKTCSRVFEDLARYFMIETGHYDILHYNEDRASSNTGGGLSASWAPDWTQKRERTPFVNYFGPISSRPRHPTVQRYGFYMNEINSTLDLQGYELATIISVSTKISPERLPLNSIKAIRDSHTDFEPDEAWAKTRSVLSELYTLYENYIPRITQELDYFHRTLMPLLEGSSPLLTLIGTSANVENESQKFLVTKALAPNATSSKATREAYKQLQTSGLPKIFKFASFASARNPHSKTLQSRRIFTSLMSLLTEERLSCETESIFHNRRCGVTSTGKRALLPLATKEGDIMCYFQHSLTPFVLRKLDNGYHFVGECLMEGISYGPNAVHIQCLNMEFGSLKTFSIH